MNQATALTGIGGPGDGFVIMAYRSPSEGFVVAYFANGSPASDSVWIVPGTHID